MDQDPLRSLKRVAAQLHTLREDPAGYTLLIGNGASQIDGIPFMEVLQRHVLRDPAWGIMLPEQTLEALTDEQCTEEFDGAWRGATETLRNRTLRKLLSKLPFTRGHEVLALLLQQRYFPLVLTTTIDNIIEQCFYKLFAGEELVRQLAVITNSARNGLNHTAWRNIKASFTPDPIIFKLYGHFPALNHAVTRRDIEDRAAALQNLDDILASDLLILGFTRFDEDSIQHIPDDGGHVYFIGTDVPADSILFRRLLRHRAHTIITDPSFTFDFVLQTFGEHLNIFQQLEDLYGRKLDKEAVHDIENRAGGDEEETKVEIVRTIGTPPPPPGEDELAVSLVKTARFTVVVEANRRISFQALNYAPPVSKEWDINEVELNELMQNLGKNIAHYHQVRDQESRKTWRMLAKREGLNLYRQMLLAHPDLGTKFALARNPPIVDDPEELTLVFQGPRTHLGIPYELLHDGEKPLAVSHPLCRRVSGVETRHPENFNLFVQSGRKPLKILLLASDQHTSTCNEEIAMLDELLKNRAKQLNLNIKTTLVRTEQASIKNVRNLLHREKFHMVHYAGHAVFDERAPENSGLLFWLQDKRGGGRQEVLTAREMAGLFANNETRLFYLSACVGATIGSEQQLLRNDTLGTMDALVRAGIPYVLGFRWYVTHTGSREFARLFYERLFQWPMVPERAALHARQELYRANANDETWTSPILVAQNPYAR